MDEAPLKTILPDRSHFYAFASDIFAGIDELFFHNHDRSDNSIVYVVLSPANTTVLHNRRDNRAGIGNPDCPHANAWAPVPTVPFPGLP